MKRPLIKAWTWVKKQKIVTMSTLLMKTRAIMKESNSLKLNSHLQQRKSNKWIQFPLSRK